MVKVQPNDSIRKLETASLTSVALSHCPPSLVVIYSLTDICYGWEGVIISVRNMHYYAMICMSLYLWEEYLASCFVLNN